MMSVLMDARQPEVLARACDLGIAMQFTNIARDVGEDARLGRLYLPLAWMREADLDPDGWLAHPVFSVELATVIARVLEAADRLYARSSAGIAELPVACRPGMHAARLLYAEIGREVQRRGLDAVSQRAVVPSTRKAALLPSVLMAAASTPAASGHEAALEAARFLVEAAARPAAGPVSVVGYRARRFEERVVWMLSLFERLERSERRLHPGMPQPTQS
jgi:phytoene synthase